MLKLNYRKSGCHTKEVRLGSLLSWSSVRKGKVFRQGRLMIRLI